MIVPIDNGLLALNGITKGGLQRTVRKMSTDFPFTGSFAKFAERNGRNWYMRLATFDILINGIVHQLHNCHVYKCC